MPRLFGTDGIRGIANVDLKRRILEDGSSVELNHGAVVTTAFTATARFCWYSARMTRAAASAASRAAARRADGGGGGANNLNGTGGAGKQGVIRIWEFA